MDEHLIEIRVTPENQLLVVDLEAHRVLVSVRLESLSCEVVAALIAETVMPFCEPHCG